MKAFTIALIAATLGMVSCAKPQKQEKPLLLATIHPYELILKQLAGSEFEVQSIIPAGASPHTWSPGPADLAAFGKAGFILSNGLGLETNLEKNLATRKAVHVEAATLLVDLLPPAEVHPSPEPEQTPEGEHQHELDPHLWTSPLLMSRLAGFLEQELATRFPNSAFIFSRNAETLRKELEDLSERIKAEKARFKNPGIVTYHNSFGHFCRETGVENIGQVQASPGKEPRPQELKALGDLIISRGVKAIFLEPQMDKQAGEVLAKEFGLKLLTLDPLGSDSKAATIAELIAQNWENMKQGFNPQ